MFLEGCSASTYPQANSMYVIYVDMVANILGSAGQRDV